MLTGLSSQNIGLRKTGIAVLAVLFIVGAYFAWDSYFSPAAKSEKENARNIDKFLEMTQRFEDTLKADVYGGKTPQETLDLFITALKKGDMDLASKYFHIETNENDLNFMTVNGWKGWLLEAQQEGKIQEILDYINISKLSILGDEGAALEHINDSGLSDFLIELRLNTRSNVWKIESM